MKTLMKVMVAAVVVACAASVEAAQINWRNGAGGAFTDGANPLSGNAVILVLGANASATPVLNWGGSGLELGAGYDYLGGMTLGADGKIPTTTLTMTGTWSAGTIDVLGGGKWGYADTVAAPGAFNTNPRDYYMVVFNNATISAESTYAVVELAGKYPTTDTGALTLAFPGQALTEWTPVPEPTSMALLALGVAALGLRRKFRA